jgi:peptide/nickel transport system substrate-binding protein
LKIHAKSVLNIVLILLISVSCHTKPQKQIESRIAAGGVQYGGVFHLNEVEDFRSLAPHSIVDITGRNIASQIYEGLVGINQNTLEVIPGLAESWEISSDGITYTFNLRKDVVFHNDACFPDGKGRNFNADDVIFSFTQLFTPSAENRLASSMYDRVLGAKNYFDTYNKNQEILESISGLLKIDDHTINIVLNEPFASFLEILATPAGWIFPKEAFEKYDIDLRSHCVGTGPFYLNKIMENEIIILARNHNYWKKDSFGNSLPYLDALKFTFIKEKKSEMLEFMKGNIDMVYGITREDVDEYELNTSMDKGEYATSDFLVQISPSLSIQYYSFKQMGEIFDDINVRLAFNYAVDRKKIVDYALNGLGIAAEHGVVPPSIKEYPIEEVSGYEFSVSKAQQYLAKAGYPGGKGFPRLTLNLNSGGGTENLLVAEAVQKMISENLNVNIDLSVTGRAQHFRQVSLGQVEFWRDSWLADYYDPENFLCLFYGKLVPDDIDSESHYNSTRYKNDEFDNLYKNAIKESDVEKRMKLYCKADQKIMDDAVIIPLYYDKTIRLLQLYVKNFPANAMEVRDLGIVYFDYNEYEKVTMKNNVSNVSQLNKLTK